MHFENDDEELMPPTGAFSKLRSTLNPAHEITPLELQDLLGGDPNPEYDFPTDEFDPSLGAGGSSGMDPGFSAPPPGSAAPPFSNGMIPLDEGGHVTDPSMVKEDMREVLRQRSIARLERSRRFQQQQLNSNSPDTEDPGQV